MSITMPPICVVSRLLTNGSVWWQLGGRRGAWLIGGGVWPSKVVLNSLSVSLSYALMGVANNY